MPENLEFVQKGVRILLPQLAAYIAREMKREYKNDWWQEVLNTLSDQINDLPYGGEWDVLVDSIDFANCLRLIKRQWNDLFRRNLARDCLTWTDELMSVRNKISHLGAKDMSRDDAERALDTMARLCSEIDFETSEEIRALLRILRYGSENGSTSGAENKPDDQPPKTSGEALVLPALSNSALPSWRDVIEPHPDVAQGRYLNAEFAADLSKVARGEGAYEYRDPVEFFARTYVTEGMKGLLIQALRRFSGSNGEPVLQLKTAFGGGKTHSLLALYHMARGGVPLDRVPNLKAVMDEAGISEIPKVKVAVIVGTALDPSRFRRPVQLPGVTVNTVWGEMAAQLAIASGNPSLYDYVKEADKKGVSPGSIALEKLFDACGPCLILMDELVAYARKLYGVDGLAAGSFENFISFIQEITEAAGASKNSMVVASIPESENEIGNEGGQKALEAIEHTFGRKESIWKPVVANEGFEIVRRRLFLDCRKPDQRDMVCAAFSRMYQENEEDFPVDSKELDYMERMRSCYPIHPEIFDRLYEEWATLDNFQRTRGVLRLMAAVIHELWMAGDGGAMIMPGSLPLDVPQVKDELMRYLPGWDSIIDSEVDGKNSTPYSLDKNIPRYAKIMAAQRVSRAIMLGSAPTVRAQRIRGIESSYIRLGIVQPGDSIADYNDALNSLRGKLSYLYSDTDGSRYWYDTHPTLRKTAQDRASRIPDPDVRFEIEKRLRSLRREAPFSGIHVCPSGSGDVSDEQTVRLVILKSEDTYDQNDENCQALKTAGEILSNRGAAPRTYRNMIVFLAPDRTHLKDLNAAVKEYLAWVSIQTDSEKLDLDSSQKAETANNISRISGTVSDRLRETYCWSIVPSVDISSDVKTVNWDVDHLIGTDTIISRAASKLIQNEQIINSWAPFLLKMELDDLLWKNDDHIQIKKLWDFLTTYCYLPRLANFSVLEDTIRAGVAGDEYFALASGINGDRYAELRYQTAVPGIYPSDYLVKLIPALKQLSQEKQKETSGPDTPANPGTVSKDPDKPEGGSGGVVEPIKPVVSAPDTHFFMSVKLDNTRVNRDLQRYLEEVITHLSAVDNCEVELTLEVNAQAADGFPQGTVRTVSENCKTLRVEDFGFEK
ncbi:MAG: DUF499 domain-containing protein [Clostridiales bacterium]|nr:DUF499 domain-containing protein [Clostridiales bacterium]